MGTVALSSLRVTADMDVSGYTSAMQAKVAADAAGSASGDALGVSYARQDAALQNVIPGVAKLSKSFIDGYGSAAQFQKATQAINDAMDRGMSLDRAGVLLDAVYKKFGLVADNALLAQKGFVSIGPVVDSLNSHYSTQAEILDRATQATARLTQAQQAQAEINSRLGVTSPTSGSAQASADAFLASVGGLDGVAAAKAQQIGQAFQASLNEALVGGISKSARDSASVFQEAFDQLDEIEKARGQQFALSTQQDLSDAFGMDKAAKSARESASVFSEQFDALDLVAKQKAAQIGQDFQDSLNRSFNIGGPSATSQGATYSALDEMMKQQEMIAQARAAQNSQASQQGINDSFGIGGQVNSARDSAAVFEAAAKAEDDLNQQAKLLRETIDPLGQAQDRLNQKLAEYQGLADAGKISTAELGKAQGLAQGIFAQQTADLTKNNQYSGLATGQAMALEAAVRHMFDAFASGRPILQDITMELGNLSYGLSGSGNFFSSLGNLITSWVTPIRLLIGSIAAIGVAAFAAATSFAASQRAIQLGLTGIGAASGATVANINDIAKASSSLSTISVSEAAIVSTAIAATGKVWVDQIGSITKLTKDFATTFGVSVAEAGTQMAKAFSDPVAGADELNKRLGFLNDATKILIQNQVAQGDRQAAIKTLTDAMAPSLGKTTDLTSGWAKAWNAVANEASNAFRAIGEAIDRNFFGGGQLDDKLSQAKARLQELQELASRRSPSVNQGLGTNSLISQQQKIVDDLQTKMANTAAQAASDTATKRLNDLSLQVGEATRAMLPFDETVRNATNSYNLLKKGLEEGVNVPDIDKTTIAMQRLGAFIKDAANVDPITNQIKLLDLQIQALDNRSIAARASIAAQQKTIELSTDVQGGDPEQKARKIQQAATLAAGGQTALDNVEKQRVATLGDLASVAEKVNSKQLDLNNVARDGVVITSAQQAAILRLTQSQEEASRLQTQVTIGVASESAIRAQLARELQTYIDRKLLDPSSTQQMADAQVVLAKRLEATAKQAEVARAPLEQLKALEIDSGSLRTQFDQFSTQSLNNFTTNMADFTTGTKSATDAFKNLGAQVLNSLEQMLIKMAIVAPIAKALQQSFGSFLPGFGGVNPSVEGSVGVVGLNGPIPTPTFMAGGGEMAAGGWGVVGERGPEIIQTMPGGGVKVHSNDNSRRMLSSGLPGFAGGGYLPPPAANGNQQQVIINNYSGAETKTTKRSQNGVDIMEVVIGKVKSDYGNGGFDGLNRARYGQQVRARPR